MRSLRFLLRRSGGRTNPKSHRYVYAGLGSTPPLCEPLSLAPRSSPKTMDQAVFSAWTLDHALLCSSWKGYNIKLYGIFPILVIIVVIVSLAQPTNRFSFSNGDTKPVSDEKPCLELRALHYTSQRLKKASLKGMFRTTLNRTPNLRPSHHPCTIRNICNFCVPLCNLYSPA